MERIPYNTLKLRAINPEMKGHPRFLVPRVQEIERAFDIHEVGRVVGQGRRAAFGAAGDFLREMTESMIRRPGRAVAVEAAAAISRRLSSRATRDLSRRMLSPASDVPVSLVTRSRAGLVRRSLRTVRTHGGTFLRRTMFTGAGGFVLFSYALRIGATNIGQAYRTVMAFLIGATDEDLALMARRICQRLLHAYDQAGSLDAALAAVERGDQDAVALDENDYAALLNAKHEDPELFQRIEIALNEGSGCADIMLEALKKNRNMLCAAFPGLCKSGSLLMWIGILAGAGLMYSTFRRLRVRK